MALNHNQSVLCSVFGFPVLTYKVQVITGDRMCAGTDANVFINVLGEQGDTGTRYLLRSTTSANKFERGQVRKSKFTINIIFLITSFFANKNIPFAFEYRCLVKSKKNMLLVIFLPCF